MPMSRVSRKAPDERATARHLLRSLSEEGRRLREASDFFLIVGSPETSRKEMRAPKDLVAFCLRQDWLEKSGDHLVLSETGWAMLRRGESDGDAFREQHQIRTVQVRGVDGTARPVLINDTESPLGWLKSRKGRDGSALISDPQFQAGERLRTDYWFAQLNARVTANWSALAPRGRARRGAPAHAADLRDEVIAAKERVSRAIEAVGPELSGMLVDICCELKGLEEAEKSRRWPQRAGKVVLQLALTRLARHYGLDRPEEAQQRPRSIRHWGSGDYRPTIDAWRGSNDQ
jgi:hypothetical protein